MKIAHLTAGTGNFHCGNCHRDNTLVKALCRLGHEAFLVPLYLPLVLDETAASPGAPLFAGGVNMFLQQKLALFRKTPRWLDRMFDATGLLRKVSEYAGMTTAKDLGEMTVETMRGLQGHQAKEWERLLAWLEGENPDVVAFSNGLLSGLAKGVKERLGCRVVCTLQGEDAFLDSLPEPFRAEAWRALGAADRYVDVWAGVSRYYAELMCRRMGLREGRVATIWNGIDLEGFAPPAAPPEKPVIGFLARLCKGKGLDLLVEAFIILVKSGRVPEVRLRLAGAKTSVDDAFLAQLQSRLAEAGCAERVEFLPNLAFEEKVAFLQSLTVLSVPATYGEAFGLYVIEALACGVPVVEPETAAFPELIEATRGGLLCAPEDAASLAAALERVVTEPGLREELSRSGRETVRRTFSAQRMASDFADLCRRA